MSVKKSTFEANLAQLESLVEELESGDLSLQKSLEKFEKGASLYKSCQQDLKKMEKKVEVIKKTLEQLED